MPLGHNVSPINCIHPQFILHRSTPHYILSIRVVLITDLITNLDIPIVADLWEISGQAHAYYSLFAN